MRDHVLSYLHAIYPDGAVGYLAVCSSEPGKKSGGMLSRHFPVTAAGLDAAADAIVSEDVAGRNVYVTVTAHAADLGAAHRGKRDEKVSASVLWLDIDRKGPGHAANDLPETTDDVVELLQAIPFEPSFVVDTGGGWHAYWKLSKPLVFGRRGGAMDPVAFGAAGGGAAAEREEFQELAKALQRTLGDAAKARGWHLDNTSDITRVLRPTGTRNHKAGRAVLPLVDFVFTPEASGLVYDYRVLQRHFSAASVRAEVKAEVDGVSNAQRLFPGLADPGTMESPVTLATTPGDGIEWDAERTEKAIRERAARNQKDPRNSNRDPILKSFLAGKPWAKKGERDSTAQALVSWLSFYTLGLGDIDKIMDMAAPSLSAMDAESGDVTDEWFEEKLVRAMSEARAKYSNIHKNNFLAGSRDRGNARGNFTVAPKLFTVPRTEPIPASAPLDTATSFGPSARVALGTEDEGDENTDGRAPSVVEGGAGPGTITPVEAPTEAPVEAPTEAPVEAPAGIAPKVAAIFGALALAPLPTPSEETEPTTAGGASYYTRAELQALADDQTQLSGVVCTLADAKERFVIQKGESFYVLKLNPDGFWRYGPPLMRGELAVSLPRELACLPEQLPKVAAPGTAGGGGAAALEAEPFFAWHVVKADGAARRKTVPELLAELCTVARGEVIYDLRIPRSYYEPRSQVFYVAACPVRSDIEPEFAQGVDEWLRTFGEDESDTGKWLDFCATITDLRHPTCGVFLSGPPDTGKTLFAMGAARIWGAKPTEMDSIFSSGGFNAELAACPLLLADETLPTDNAGRPISTKLLRRLIGSDRRTLRRKFMSEAAIVGAVRCLFLANNEDMIGQGDESLGADALEAVAGRFLHIRVGEKAHDFIVQSGGRARGTSGWVDGDIIAKHLLWLRDNRVVQYGHRFIVSGHESKVSKLLATNGTIPSLVCEWLCRFLDRPLESMIRKGSVILGGNKFWVNGQALLDSWDDLIKSDRAAPTLAKINKALGGISFPSVEKRANGSGGVTGSEREYVTVPGAAPGAPAEKRRMRYWKISPEIILQFADSNQIGDDSGTMRSRIEGPEIVFKGTAVAAAFGNVVS